MKNLHKILSLICLGLVCLSILIFCWFRPKTAKEKIAQGAEPIKAKSLASQAQGYSWLLKQGNEKRPIKAPCVILCGISAYAESIKTQVGRNTLKQIKEEIAAAETFFNSYGHGAAKVFHLSTRTPDDNYALKNRKSLQKSLNKIKTYLEEKQDGRHDALILYMIGLSSSADQLLFSTGHECGHQKIIEGLQELPHEELPCLIWRNTFTLKPTAPENQGVPTAPEQRCSIPPRMVHLYANQAGCQVKDEHAQGLASTFVEVLREVLSQPTTQGKTLQALFQEVNTWLIQQSKGRECAQIMDYRADHLYIQRHKESPPTATSSHGISITTLKNPYIFIIGASAYQGKASLPGTTQDIKLLKEIFTSGNYGFAHKLYYAGEAIEKKGVQLYRQNKADILADLQQVQAYLETAEGQKHDGLLLFFCGHGQEDAFLPSDVGGSVHPLAYDTIYNYFHEENLPNWANRPIISCTIACRGGDIALGEHKPADDTYHNDAEGISGLTITATGGQAVFPLIKSLRQCLAQHSDLPLIDLGKTIQQTEGEAASRCFYQYANMPIDGPYLLSNTEGGA